MYVDDGITIDEIDAVSGTLTVGKINSKINGINTRSIIQFTKNTIHSGFDDLDIDIKLKSKTDPQTTIYVVVYGITGIHSDVSIQVWDRFYYYDVNKEEIDFESTIDVNNHQIIGLSDGSGDKHAINLKQLNELKSQIINNSIIGLQPLKLLEAFYFPDNKKMEINNNIYKLSQTGLNHGDYTIYLSFKHDDTDNALIKITANFRGIIKQVITTISKTTLNVNINYADNIGKLHFAFGIAADKQGKQIIAWNWSKDSKISFHYNFSSHFTERTIYRQGRRDYELTNILIESRNPITVKGLVTKNVYSFSHPSYGSMKKYEISQGSKFS